MNLARSSIAAEEKNRKQKTSQNGKQNEGEVAPSFTPSFLGSSVLSRSTPGSRETRRQGASSTNTLMINVGDTTNDI